MFYATTTKNCLSKKMSVCLCVCVCVCHITFLSGYICSDTLRMFWHVVTSLKSTTLIVAQRRTYVLTRCHVTEINYVDRGAAARAPLHWVEDKLEDNNSQTAQSLYEQQLLQQHRASIRSLYRRSLSCQFLPSVWKWTWRISSRFVFSLARLHLQEVYWSRPFAHTPIYKTDHLEQAEPMVPWSSKPNVAREMPGLLLRRGDLRRLVFIV